MLVFFHVSVCSVLVPRVFKFYSVLGVKTLNNKQTIPGMVFFRQRRKQTFLRDWDIGCKRPTESLRNYWCSSPVIAPFLSCLNAFDKQH